MSKTFDYSIFYYYSFLLEITMFGVFFFDLFTPSAETENYVLGHFRPNIFGDRIFGASLVAPLLQLSLGRVRHLYRKALCVCVWYLENSKKCSISAVKNGRY